MELIIFWQNVNSLIKEQHKTQKTLSIECGFSERRIQNLSSSNRSPDIHEAVAIAKALGTTVEYLVTGEESNKDSAELKELKTKVKQFLTELL